MRERLCEPFRVRQLVSQFARHLVRQFARQLVRQLVRHLVRQLVRQLVRKSGAPGSNNINKKCVSE